MVQTNDETYAGRSLGLPADGPGSLAPLWRRVIGVFFDWIIARQIAVWILGVDASAGGWGSWIILGVFAVMTVVPLAVVGATFGHWLLGLQLRQVRPGNYPLQTLARTALLCLFLPAILSGSDGRGFHDRWAGTVLLRR